jgi:uncharacterized ion transporter superfamily protein YfcC
MKKTKSVPSPITILMAIIILAAIATWLIPAGKYNTLAKAEGDYFTISTPKGDTSIAFNQHNLDSLQIKIPLEKFASGAIRKPVSLPGTYQKLDRNGQGFLAILQAPIKGIYDTIDIILFILVIGGFMHVFNESGAMLRGLTSLTHTMKGKESWLIIILTFLFSFGGASYGMAEEGLVFYPIMVPLFLAAGYDLIVPVAVIFAGTQLGTLSSFSNPFSVIVASNAAGINWQNGFWERIILFVLSTALMIGYIIYYANKIKKDPSASYVFKVDGQVASPFPTLATTEKSKESLDLKTKLLLLLFISSFLVMIFGVVKLEWWLPEMTALFLGAAILLAFILRLNEKDFITQFIKGAESLLSVAFIVGIARGVTIILNDGKISDSILYYSAKMVGGFPPVLFIIILLALYMVFTLFISSSSGMAVLTMPIIGALAILVNVPGKQVVNAYLFGMGIMGFITPTGLILPSLALVNVSFKAWMKFITPLLIMLFILCAFFLIGGLYW